MRFEVPQYIEAEDKIIGPLTIKQFLFLAAGGGIIFISWFYLKLWAFALLAFVVGAISISLAFQKINGRPVYFFIINIFGYVLKPKIYLWKKSEDNKKDNDK